MAYQINWVTKVITIPQADLLPLGGALYQLNILDFRKEVRRLLWVQTEGLYAEEALEWTDVVTLGGTPYAALLRVINGYTITFEDGQYAVNVVGANSNIGDVTNVNQVSVRPQNSAGLINLDILLASAYSEKVIVDVNNGFSGTQSPIGTRARPSNNYTQAKEIALANSIIEIKTLTSATLAEDDFSAGFNFTSDSPFVQLIVPPNADFSNCSASRVNISGEMDGFNTLEQLSLGAATNVSGYLFQVSLTSTISLNGPTAIYDCYSQVPGTGLPDISVGANDIAMRDFRGSVRLTNMTGGIHSIGLREGRLIIDASCSGGDVYMRGKPYEIVDNSGGAVNVIDQTESQKITEIHRILGLDPNAPLVINEDGTITAGGITINAVTTGTTPNRVTTQTRQ